MIYLEFVYYGKDGKENVFHFDVKVIIFPGILAGAIITKNFYNLCIFGAYYQKLHMSIKRIFAIHRRSQFVIL